MYDQTDITKSRTAIRHNHTCSTSAGGIGGAPQKLESSYIFFRKNIFKNNI